MTGILADKGADFENRSGTPLVMTALLQTGISPPKAQSPMRETFRNMQDGNTDSVSCTHGENSDLLEGNQSEQNNHPGNINSSSSKAEDIKQIDASAKRKVYHNVVTLAVACVLNFSSYVSMESLQTSLYPENGFGFIILSTVYISRLFSSMIAPGILSLIRPKFIFISRYVTDACFLACNLYPQPYLLLAGAIIMGMARGPSVVAENTFIAEMSYRHARITGEPKRASLSFIGGIYQSITNCYWFLVPIPSLILMYGQSIFPVDDSLAGNTTTRLLNSSNCDLTFNESVQELSLNFSTLTLCGLDNCPGMKPLAGSSFGINGSALYLMIAVTISMSCTSAVVVILFLENVKFPKSDIALCRKTMGFCSGMMNLKLVLFIPLFLLLSSLQATLRGSYNSSCWETTLWTEGRSLFPSVIFGTELDGQ